jgi:hypothetical protein
MDNVLLDPDGCELSFNISKAALRKAYRADIHEEVVWVSHAVTL